MDLISCMCDSRKNNYVLYHSALLIFAIAAIIPLNLHLTRLSFPIPIILFAVGFYSLFMVARNETVGFGLIKFLRMDHRSKKPIGQWQQMDTYGNSALSEPIQYVPFTTENYEEPIALLQNFIDELTRKHEEKMDWTTLDSFRKLNARVEKLVVKN
jgi:hypothetical protein